MPAGKRRETLQEDAEALFSRDLLERVFPFDSHAAHIFALIFNESRQQGRPMSYPDAQIAAIARAHRATIATRNTKDFEHCGAPVVNPWLA